MNRKYLLSALTTVIVATLFACSADNLTTPTRKLSPPGANANAFASIEDDCGQGFFSCHFDDLTFGDDNWECPDGCHTYPLTTTQRKKVNTALALISGEGSCGLLRSYIQHQLVNQRIRYYNIYDGNNADLHFSIAEGDAGPDWSAMIHLWNDRLDDQTDIQLANTLAHEAYHGYYNDPNESLAQMTADTCVGGGFP
jgi:hypothetical protein